MGVAAFDHAVLAPGRVPTTCGAVLMYVLAGDPCA